MEGVFRKEPGVVNADHLFAVSFLLQQLLAVRLPLVEISLNRSLISALCVLPQDNKSPCFTHSYVCTTSRF